MCFSTKMRVGFNKQSQEIFACMSYQEGILFATFAKDACGWKSHKCGVQHPKSDLQAPLQCRINQRTPGARFELATNGLTVHCSTAELTRKNIILREDLVKLQGALFP